MIIYSSNFKKENNLQKGNSKETPKFTLFPINNESINHKDTSNSNKFNSNGLNHDDLFIIQEREKEPSLVIENLKNRNNVYFSEGSNFINTIISEESQRDLLNSERDVESKFKCINNNSWTEKKDNNKDFLENLNSNDNKNKKTKENLENKIENFVFEKIQTINIKSKFKVIEKEGIIDEKLTPTNDKKNLIDSIFFDYSIKDSKRPNSSNILNNLNNNTCKGNTSKNLGNTEINTQNITKQENLNIIDNNEKKEIVKENINIDFKSEFYYNEKANLGLRDYEFSTSIRENLFDKEMEKNLAKINDKKIIKNQTKCSEKGYVGKINHPSSKKNIIELKDLISNKSNTNSYMDYSNNKKSNNWNNDQSKEKSYSYDNFQGSSVVPEDISNSNINHSFCEDGSSQIRSECVNSFSSCNTQNLDIGNRRTHNVEYDLKINKGEISESSRILDSENMKYLISGQKQEKMKKKKTIFLKLSNITRRNFRKLLILKNVCDSLTDDEESEEDKTVPHSAMENKKFKAYWQLFNLIFIVYFATMGIFRFTFFPNQTTGFFFFFEVLADIFFLIDIILNFFRPFPEKNKKIIFDKNLIAYNYLSGWFIFDLLGSLPLNIVLLINYLQIIQDPAINKIVFSDNNNLRNDTILDEIMYPILISNTFLYKLLRWFRIIRVIKFFLNKKKNRSLEIIFGKNFKSNGFMSIISIFIILTHISTCLWIFVGGINETDIRNSWIKSISNHWSLSKFDIYVASLYFNLLTIYSVGYGDIVSKNNSERIYNIFILTIGNWLYSFGISYLSFLFANINEIDNKYNQKLSIMNKIEKKYNIPKSLNRQIKRSLNNMHTKVHSEKFIIFDSLPLVLKRELILSMNKKGISNFMFFKNSDKEFIITVLPLLKTQQLSKNDILVSIGGIVEEIYLINCGILSICLDDLFDKIQISQLKRNNHFGDILIHLNEKSPYLIQCSTKYCEYLTLGKSDYNKISVIFNKTVMKILEFSCQFLEKIEKNKAVIIELFDEGMKLPEICNLIKNINYHLMNRNFYNHFYNNHEMILIEDFILNNDIKKIKKFAKTQMREKDFKKFFRGIFRGDLIVEQGWPTTKNKPSNTDRRLSQIPNNDPSDKNQMNRNNYKMKSLMFKDQLKSMGTRIKNYFSVQEKQTSINNQAENLNSNTQHDNVNQKYEYLTENKAEDKRESNQIENDINLVNEEILIKNKLKFMFGKKLEDIVKKSEKMNNQNLNTINNSDSLSISEDELQLINYSEAHNILTSDNPNLDKINSIAKNKLMNQKNSKGEFSQLQNNSLNQTNLIPNSKKRISQSHITNNIEHLNEKFFGEKEDKEYKKNKEMNDIKSRALHSSKISVRKSDQLPSQEINSAPNNTKLNLNNPENLMEKNSQILINNYKISDKLIKQINPFKYEIEILDELEKSINSEDKIFSGRKKSKFENGINKTLDNNMNISNIPTRRNRDSSPSFQIISELKNNRASNTHQKDSQKTIKKDESNLCQNLKIDEVLEENKPHNLKNSEYTFFEDSKTNSNKVSDLNNSSESLEKYKQNQGKRKMENNIKYISSKASELESASNSSYSTFNNDLNKKNLKDKINNKLLTPKIINIINKSIGNLSSEKKSKSKMSRTLSKNYKNVNIFQIGSIKSNNNFVINKLKLPKEYSDLKKKRTQVEKNYKKDSKNFLSDESLKKTLIKQKKIKKNYKKLFEPQELKIKLTCSLAIINNIILDFSNPNSNLNNSQYKEEIISKQIHDKITNKKLDESYDNCFSKLSNLNLIKVSNENHNDGKASFDNFFLHVDKERFSDFDVSEFEKLKFKDINEKSSEDVNVISHPNHQNSKLIKETGVTANLNGDFVDINKIHDSSDKGAISFRSNHKNIKINNENRENQKKLLLINSINNPYNNNITINEFINKPIHKRFSYISIQNKYNNMNDNNGAKILQKYIENNTISRNYSNLSNFSKTKTDNRSIHTRGENYPNHTEKINSEVISNFTKNTDLTKSDSNNCIDIDKASSFSSKDSRKAYGSDKAKYRNKILKSQYQKKLKKQKTNKSPKNSINKFPQFLDSDINKSKDYQKLLHQGHSLITNNINKFNRRVSKLPNLEKLLNINKAEYDKNKNNKDQSFEVDDDKEHAVNQSVFNLLLLPSERKIKNFLKYPSLRVKLSQHNELKKKFGEMQKRNSVFYGNIFDNKNPEKYSKPIPNLIRTISKKNLKAKELSRKSLDFKLNIETLPKIFQNNQRKTKSITNHNLINFSKKRLSTQYTNESKFRKNYLSSLSLSKVRNINDNFNLLNINNSNQNEKIIKQNNNQTNHHEKSKKLNNQKTSKFVKFDQYENQNKIKSYLQAKDIKKFDIYNQDLNSQNKINHRIDKIMELLGISNYSKNE